MAYKADTVAAVAAYMVAAEPNTVAAHIRPAPEAASSDDWEMERIKDVVADKRAVRRNMVIEAPKYPADPDMPMPAPSAVKFYRRGNLCK